MTDVPVDSFRAAALLLRRPFTPPAVKFKLQTVNKNGGGGMVIAYIDARLVVERLNMVVPDLWHDEYQRTNDGGMLCKLTVDGLTRVDVGDGSFAKAAFSDALKRAAVKFGIGVSLYAIPTVMVWKNQGQIETWERNGKWQGKLTAEGEQFARTSYEAWLSLVGVHAFGEPLDHGDVDGAQGDVEVNVDPDTGEIVDRISVEVADTIGDAIRLLDPYDVKVGAMLQQHGAVVDTTNLEVTVRSLPAASGDAVISWLSAQLEGVKA